MAALQEIENKAMYLELTDRALLAEHLLASLDVGEDVDAEKLWIKEAEARYAAYQQGNISSSPADEVLERVSKRLK